MAIFYQLSATWHYDTIMQDISGFTFSNGLPKEINPFTSRPKQKGFKKPLGRRVSKKAVSYQCACVWVWCAGKETYHNLSFKTK